MHVLVRHASKGWALNLAVVWDYLNLRTRTTISDAQSSARSQASGRRKNRKMRVGRKAKSKKAEAEGRERESERWELMEEGREIPCSRWLVPVEESCTRRSENPEISAASGKRITLGAICPYSSLAAGPRDKRRKLNIKCKQVQHRRRRQVEAVAVAVVAA